MYLLRGLTLFILVTIGNLSAEVIPAGQHELTILTLTPTKGDVYFYQSLGQFKIDVPFIVTGDFELYLSWEEETQEIQKDYSVIKIDYKDAKYSAKTNFLTPLIRENDVISFKNFVDYTLIPMIKEMTYTYKQKSNGKIFDINTTKQATFNPFALIEYFPDHPIVPGVEWKVEQDIDYKDYKIKVEIIRNLAEVKNGLALIRSDAKFQFPLKDYGFTVIGKVEMNDALEEASGHLYTSVGKVSFSAVGTSKDFPVNFHEFLTAEFKIEGKKMNSH